MMMITGKELCRFTNIDTVVCASLLLTVHTILHTGRTPEITIEKIMSTCHQAHNIPWNTFLELLHKVPSSQPYEMLEGKAVYNSFELSFTPNESGAEIKKVKFFAAKVHAAIKEFSKTERVKYDNIDIDQITELYGPESFNAYLNEGALQTIAGWEYTGLQNDSQLHALKELFLQEKISSLLYLVRNGFPLEKYQYDSSFFIYGLGLLKMDCLTLYIHLNVLLASGTLQNPDQWYMQWRRFLEKEILNKYAGARMHSMLFKDYIVRNPKFEDLDELQALLKKVFRILYYYDMVLAERGVNISWEQEALEFIGSYFVQMDKKSNKLWLVQMEKLEENAMK